MYDHDFHTLTYDIDLNKSIILENVDFDMKSKASSYQLHSFFDWSTPTTNQNRPLTPQHHGHHYVNPRARVKRWHEVLNKCFYLIPFSSKRWHGTLLRGVKLLRVDDRTKRIADNEEN